MMCEDPSYCRAGLMVVVVVGSGGCEPRVMFRTMAEDDAVVSGQDLNDAPRVSNCNQDNVLALVGH